MDKLIALLSSEYRRHLEYKQSEPLAWSLILYVFVPTLLICFYSPFIEWINSYGLYHLIWIIPTVYVAWLTTYFFTIAFTSCVYDWKTLWNDIKTLRRLGLSENLELYYKVDGAIRVYLLISIVIIISIVSVFTTLSNQFDLVGIYSQIDFFEVYSKFCKEVFPDYYDECVSYSEYLN